MCEREVHRRMSRVRSLVVAWAATLMLQTHPARAQATQDDSVLMQHGLLKVQTISIHGPTPLILLLTDAPVGAAPAERRYRAMLTDLIARSIATHGYSYYVVRDSLAGGRTPGQPGPPMEYLEAVARHVRAALERKQLWPAGYVGLAEGAVVAAHLADEDSLPRILAALATSLPGKGAKQVPHWEVVIDALNHRVPQVLAMQGSCDGPMPDALMQAGHQPQRLLLLPNHDRWLAPMLGTTCAMEPQVRVPSLQVAELVGEWVSSQLSFPE